MLGWSESKVRNLLYRGLADVRERLLAEGVRWNSGTSTETTRLQELYARRVAAGRDGAGAHATPEAILAVVQREGSETERLATLEHVMACAACHREYEWLKAVDQAGFEAEAEPAGGQRRPWWQGRTLALAASLAMAVGAAVAVSGVLDRGRSGSGAPSRTSPARSRAARQAGGPLTFAWHAGAGVVALRARDPARGRLGRLRRHAPTPWSRSQSVRLLPDTAYRWWVREVTDGAEPRSSAFRDLRLSGR